MDCHTHGCSCGSSEHTASRKGCCGGSCSDKVITLSATAVAMLEKLAQIPFLPVTRFVMGSSKSPHLSSIALAPVYLENAEESMEQVKESAAALLQLSEYGLIDLDYDSPLERCDYALYEAADLYAYFKKTVQDGQQQADFLFDLPRLERGSLALTTRGQMAITQLDI